MIFFSFFSSKFSKIPYFETCQEWLILAKAGSVNSMVSRGVSGP